MHVALATCAKLPDHEVDDAPLHDAVVTRGVTLSRPVWNDPTVDWSAFDACLIRTTWDYQNHHDAFVDWARRVGQMTRLFNPADVVIWNTHKSYLLRLGELGVPLAPTVWLDRGRSVDLARTMADRRWPRGFLKPAVGATARETLRFDADDLTAATRHIDRLLPHEDLLLQPYLPNVETEGELSAIWIDGQFTHGVRKVPVAGDYRVQDDFGAADEPCLVEGDLLDVARTAIDGAQRDLGDLLYARVDVLRDESGALCVTELELIEPSLFFRHAPHAADRLAEGLVRQARPA